LQRDATQVALMKFGARTEEQLLLNDSLDPFVEAARPHDRSGSNLETNGEFNSPRLSRY
jgi:hypothetical protein